jgi:cytoskeletal protein CcmA (bactofilin family)
MTNRKSNAFTVIDEGTELEGTLSFQGRSIINGVLKGHVAGYHITIGEKGLIDAEITADHLMVAGELSGNISVSERLVILKSGKCAGKVTCKDLMVEPGGVLNAQVHRISGEAETEKNASNK